MTTDPADRAPAKLENDNRTERTVATPPSAAPTAPGPGAQPGRAGRRVTVDTLNAFFGASQALRDVSIEFAPNEVTALIGPSGSGKSTVVRCVNRMHEEISGARATGRVLLDDVDVYGSEVDVVSVRRTVGMVFQKPNPFPTMSIFENVAAGLRLTGQHRGARLRERVEQSLRGAALWDEVKDRLDEPGIGLSGGQQQRLCIARTIAVEPEVILLDEPASALDPISTLKIEELMEQLKPRYTIAIVTHNMQQAARIADRTAFMLSGELIEFGPTEKIFTNPTDKRTEEYVSGKFG